MCCFVLLTRFWEIVTVVGFPHVNRPQIITCGGRILTLYINYVAGYTGPLLFLFERTHSYYVDNQGASGAYGVATTSRRLQIAGLFCTRAL